MQRENVTCPESSQLEEIDAEPTPFGLVVLGCSHFEPRCALSCTRACARRLDLRDRTDDASERVLIVVASAAITRSVAAALGEELARDGLVVELADADTHAAPPPHDYDAVIIGSPAQLGRRSRAIVEYITRHRDALASMPAFWFAVGRNDVASSDRLQRATGWLPLRSFGLVRPSWRVRWFDDPSSERAPRIQEIARAIGDEIPAREPGSP
ncbi:MAG TPA: flavodoxin domain-containing protein [Kofleriaceae bacterium]